MGLKEYASAVEFFKRSQELCGSHHVTWHNMGICLYYLDQLADAEKCFKTSLAIKPTYAEAHSWLAQVREKVAKGGGGSGARTHVDDDSVDDDSDASRGDSAHSEED